MSIDAQENALALTGHLSPNLSRWLWLIKMFLAVPHFVILVGLWVWFVLTTPIAAIAILITGRYPQRLFDINVGVLRWNWRVGFYVYGAIATDIYPPFALRDLDYPAQLDITYPTSLSRGKVLVKWLLAIPQLIVVFLLGGTILLYPLPALNDLDTAALGGYSILNLLVVIAGFFLLITGRYPAAFSDFLMGINRWMYRVVVYVALLSDQYPPFRLDTGPTESPHRDDSPARAHALRRTLHTERLTIRPATTDDERATWAFRSLDEVNEWLTGTPEDIEGYHALFAEPDRLSTTVIVELRPELGGHVIGDFMLRVEDAWAQIDVADQARDQQVELGWTLDPAHSGHGYATEAVRELIRYSFDELGVHRVVANCFRDNDASRRLMERVGMRRELHAVRDSLHRSGQWLDTLGYAIVKDE